MKARRNYTCDVCGREIMKGDFVANIEPGKSQFKAKLCKDCYERLYSKPLDEFVIESKAKVDEEKKEEVEKQKLVEFVEGEKPVEFYDYGGFLDVLEKAYRLKLNVLIIGAKGVGKTTMVRKFAQMKGKRLREINFSLRTREHHLLGMMSLNNGSTEFQLGVIPLSMKEGSILYLDELNAAEADVLLRLDEALDDRRQLTLKEAGDLVIKAHKDWWVVATINPLTHAGTKELPPQLISRFPIRIYMDYPSPDVEYNILKTHLGDDLDKIEDEIMDVIKLANKLRRSAEAGELDYSPSIRETLTYAKLRISGVDKKTALKSVFLDVYGQFGEFQMKKVKEFIGSVFGYAVLEGGQ